MSEPNETQEEQQQEEHHYVRDRILVPLGIPVAVLVGVGFIIVNLSRVLLAVSKNGAVVVAGVVMAVIVAGAAWAAAKPSMRPRSLIAMLAVFSLLTGTAGAIAANVGEREFHKAGEKNGHGEPKPGGHGTGSPTASPSPGGDADVTITAQNIAFNKNTFDLPANEDVSIAFTNLDADLHNVAIYKTAQASESIFQGEIFGGPNKSMTYTFTSPAAGTYFFRCDVHPAMSGTVRVS